MTIKKICSMAKKVESLKKLSESTMGDTVYEIMYINVEVYDSSYNSIETRHERIKKDKFDSLSQIVPYIGSYVFYDDELSDPKNWSAEVVDEGEIRLMGSYEDDNGYTCDVIVGIDCYMYIPADEESLNSEISKVGFGN